VIQPSDLNAAVAAYAQNLEADFFGVADLAPAYEAILAQGGPAVARYPRAISMGVGLLHSIVDQLPRRAERAVMVAYQSHAYDVVNLRLDAMAARMASRLQAAGYTALPVPASQRVDAEKICSFFSHKLAAGLAGLGWIGRSCLLVTPEVGPRVRWTTVLTDAPLQATGQSLAPRCGDCHKCVDICPVQAFTGRLFDPSEPREARFDAARCDQYMKELERTTGLHVCGLCLYVCPHGHCA
jgi:epoxyqueuosine reductase QueG